MKVIEYKVVEVRFTQQAIDEDWQPFGSVYVTQQTELQHGIPVNIISPWQPMVRYETTPKIVINDGAKTATWVAGTNPPLTSQITLKPGEQAFSEDGGKTWTPKPIDKDPGKKSDTPSSDHLGKIYEAVNTNWMDERNFRMEIEALISTREIEAHLDELNRLPDSKLTLSAKRYKEKCIEELKQRKGQDNE